jgi:hypothetical protein
VSVLPEWFAECDKTNEVVHPAQEVVDRGVSATDPVIEVGENGEVLAMFFDASKGQAHLIVFARGLRKEAVRPESKVIAHADETLGIAREGVGGEAAVEAVEGRNGQGNAESAEEVSPVYGGCFGCDHLTETIIERPGDHK